MKINKQLNSIQPNQRVFFFFYKVSNSQIMKKIKSLNKSFLCYSSICPSTKQIIQNQHHT